MTPHISEWWVSYRILTPPHFLVLFLKLDAKISCSVTKMFKYIERIQVSATPSRYHTTQMTKCHQCTSGNVRRSGPADNECSPPPETGAVVHYSTSSKGYARLRQDYRSIKLISPPSKSPLRVILNWLANQTERTSDEEQACFRPQRSATELTVNLRLLLEKNT